MTAEPRHRRHERGASAVLLAASATLLLGMAAIAIDIGLGFNERRVDQAVADTAVMAGAVSFTIPAESNDNTVVTKVLEMARANLKGDNTDETAWRAMWINCRDPERLAWDPGTGTPITLAPLNVPTSWTLTAPAYAANTKIDCISKGSSYLRVRIPDQQTRTVFARIFGASTLITSADAVAQVNPGSGGKPLLPLGIVGGAQVGELCLTTSGGGTAVAPCQGPSAGSFGPVNSEIFRDYFVTTLPQCANPGAPELSQNIALGIDHFIDVWGDEATNPENILPGAAHPGDVTVESYSEITHDQCRIVAGAMGPQVGGETFPANMLRVLTGFPSNEVEAGLISNTIYNYVEDGMAKTKPSLLQQGLGGGFPERPIVKRRQGANNIVYRLNNRGPWEYLDDSLVDAVNAATADRIEACDDDNYDDENTTDKVANFHRCLRQHDGTFFLPAVVAPLTDVIFDDAILDSSRFTWAPQYWHAASTTGTSWQPVHRYRMVYIGGLYFNCSGASCGLTFYPDESVNSEMCLPAGGSNCQQLSLDQLTGWLMPFGAMSETVQESYPGARTPNVATLYR